MTVVHCKQRITNVFGRGLSVFINWHSVTKAKKSRGYRNTIGWAVWNLKNIWISFRKKKALVNSCHKKAVFESYTSPSAGLTCHWEIIKWRWRLIIQVRLLLIANEGTITLEDEIPGPPCFDIFTWVRQREAILIIMYQQVLNYELRFRGKNSTFWSNWTKAFLLISLQALIRLWYLL